MQASPAATNESMSAGPCVVGGDPGEHEDAGADDGAHAERGELEGTEHAPQPVLAAASSRRMASGLAGERGFEARVLPAD